MKLYDPAIHTPEALSAEITSLQMASADTLLGGSLGRAVLYARYLGDPETEYRYRNQEPVSAGHIARDIDTIGPVSLPAYEPFEVDISCFASPHLSFERNGGDWFLTASRHNFAEPLHPAVMMPVEGSTVYDTKALTLPPQTLLALYGLKGQVRAKDIATRTLLEHVSSNADDARFPDELLDPFRKLKKVNDASLYIKLQNTYRSKVPENLRIRAVPCMQFMKRLLLK